MKNCYGDLSHESDVRDTFNMNGEVTQYQATEGWSVTAKLPTSK